MKVLTLGQNSRDFLISEVERYLNGGFGSMNKNDFEVLIFKALLMGREKSESNYSLSRSLRVPESKIKRLIYESDLRYQQLPDDLYSQQKLEQLDILLSNVIIKDEGKKIQFAIEDPSLRKFLDSTLKEANRFSDSSFNSEIVKISLDDLDYILSKSSLAHEKLKRIRENAKDVTGQETKMTDAIHSIVESVSIGPVNLNLKALFNRLDLLIREKKKKTNRT